MPSNINECFYQCCDESYSQGVTVLSPTSRKSNEDMDSLFLGQSWSLPDHVALAYYKSFSCGALYRLSQNKSWCHSTTRMVRTVVLSSLQVVSIFQYIQTSCVFDHEHLTVS